MSKLFCTILLISGLLTLTSCVSLPARAAYAPWVYTDLRLLDPAGEEQPTRDLIAVYTRQMDGDVQIRLDLLDHAPLPDYDLYLALDTSPGGTYDLPIDARAALEWDTLLVIPASGELQALDAVLQPRPGVALSVVRDSVLDTIVVSLRQAIFPPTRLQVFLTPPGASSVADQAGPVSSQAQPPAPARVLFAFWNSYPAYTPATALRRWNGAHTGPLGGSHGLGILLHAARQQGIPLALLDLKSPASLAALDYAGKLDQVQDMVRRGLLILPEDIPDLLSVGEPTFDDLPGQVIARQRRIARRFGLPDSAFAFAPLDALPWRPFTNFVFARLPAGQPLLPTSGDMPGTAVLIPSASKDRTEAEGVLAPSYLVSRQGQRVLFLPADLQKAEQATLDGPSLEIRRAWVETALAAGQANGRAALLLLGGSLPESAWGAAGPAQASFRYLRAHPWIQPLDAQGLLGTAAVAMAAGFQPTTGYPPDAQPYSFNRPDLSPEQNLALLHALQQAPDNALGQAAWQAYQALFAPVYPTSPDLPALRSAYVGQVWSLLEAAKWAANPTRQATCTADPDGDGYPECVLSSQSMYAQFEIDAGALAYLFALDNSVQNGAAAPRQAHQMIGPTSQFITGLSDPNEWDLSRGLAADPAAISGAFAGPGGGYRVETPPGEGVVFVSPDNQVRKHYRLAPDGIDISVETAVVAPGMAMKIPLALDAWRRFQPGWAGAYHAAPLSQGWQWELEPGLAVQIISSAASSLQTFNDSRPLLADAENPNLDYPPAHTLPFPYGLVNVSVTGSFDLQIRFIIAP